jgi:hypothetical protein
MNSGCISKKSFWVIYNMTITYTIPPGIEDTVYIINNRDDGYIDYYKCSISGIANKLIGSNTVKLTEVCIPVSKNLK